MQPAVTATESSLDLSAAQRKRVVWRADGGAGTDDLIRWLLARDYHILVKGHSNRRAQVLAQRVSRWDPYQDTWLGEVSSPVNFGRPVKVFVKKRLKKGHWYHSYYVTTLQRSSKRQFMAHYDQRGAAEVEQFRNDKMGLHLASRRKSKFPAQKALILLTDLAHNLLIHFHHSALAGTKFQAYGSKRIVHNLLHIPGRLVFDGKQLRRIELLSSHPNSSELCICLEKYILGD